jgi:hypothetical protein
MTMSLDARVLVDLMAGKRSLSQDKRKALTFIADQEQKGNITGRQARMLQEQVMAVYLEESLRIHLKPSTERITRKARQLEHKIASILADGG